MIIDFKFASIVISFVEWPARSPDLTPLDFFLWGVLKNQVFSDKPKTLNDLKENNINALKDITPEMCKKVTESIIKRCHHHSRTSPKNFGGAMKFCPNFVTFSQIMILEYISDMTKKLSEFLRQKPILS